MIRIFDIIFSALALGILTPLLFPIVIILKFTGEGEVFFRQERIGLAGKKFSVLKFATMLRNSPNMGSGTITVKGDPRVLPVGRILRKTKINELPQLLNVLRGEMSLIGARPHALRDLRGVDAESLKIVHSIRPGLSGAASIVFRNEDKVLYDQTDPRYFYDEIIAPYKASIDVWYAENISVLKYFILILLTVIVVITGKPKILFEIFPDIPKLPIKLQNLI